MPNASLTLYHNDMSVCSAKVRVALAEKQLNWTGVHLNLRAGDAQDPEYVKLNPKAVVPTLVHDGRVIIESTVICEFIDDQWAHPPLKPEQGYGRAQMRLWTKQLDEGLHDAIAVLSSAIAFRYQWLDRPQEDRERWVKGIPLEDRRLRSASLLEHGLQSPYFEPAVRRYEKLFADLEQALASSPWLAGMEISLADISFAPYLARLRHLGFAPLFDRHARVEEWSRRVADRPSVIEGVDRWFNEKYLALFEDKRPHATPVLAKLLG